MLSFLSSSVLHTWQSSPLVRTSPFMYCLSSVGEIPKLLPIQRVSILPSGWLISTAPFRITYQRSSCRQVHEDDIIKIIKLYQKFLVCRDSTTNINALLCILLLLSCHGLFHSYVNILYIHVYLISCSVETTLKYEHGCRLGWHANNSVKHIMVWLWISI